MKKINIAIIGLGNIGSYLYKFLIKNRHQIYKKNNVMPKVVCISARNKRKNRSFAVPKKIWEDDYKKIIKRRDIDLIIELIGGSEGAARNLVFSALKSGKHVITANKALISKHGDLLSKIAEKNKVNLEFEAAVCGGVPVIRSIKEGLTANKIKKVQGILNGTSNFILTCMSKENISFDEALEKAKLLGYAETNPSSDLSGDDVASKLKILASLCFNSFIINNITVEGIKNIDKEDIKNASILGYNIKLIGTAEQIKNKVYQRVHPALIKKSSYIASIDGVLNAVITNGHPVGESVIQGEGAGPEATTSALVSDISSVLRGNIKYPFAISNRERKRLKYGSIDSQSYSAYFRVDVQDKSGVLTNITKVFSENKVSIKRLIQNPYKSKKYASIVIITHTCKDFFLQKTIKKLSNKPYINKKPKIIRIES